jgi:predicted CXXCH cytochrome family protein
VVRSAREEGQNVLLLGLGDFAGRPDEQGRIKSDVALRSMDALDFDAMLIGERELALGDEFVLERMDKSGVPIVNANMTYEGRRVGDRYRIVKRGGVRIGLVGVTIDQLRVGQEEWSIGDPIEAVREVMPELRRKADVVVVMSHLGYRESLALTETVEGIDLTLVAHGGRRVKTPMRVGEALLAEAGDKGKFLGKITLAWDRGQKKIVGHQGELVMLSRDIPDDPEMAALYEEYQERVKDMVKEDIRGRSADAREAASDFMGAVWCRSCHSEIYEAWNATPHAEAFLTLKKDGEEYNPECVGCHTTGYGHGGFLTVEETAAFINVQCEACHGPASRHVATKGKESLQPQNDAVCRKCHAGERGEGFDYDMMKGLVH